MEMEKADEQGAGAQGGNGVVEETLENIMASTGVMGETYCRCSGGVQHGGDVDAYVADINAVLGKNMDCERTVIGKSSDLSLPKLIHHRGEHDEVFKSSTSSLSVPN